MAPAYLRTLSFWLSLGLGWIVTACILNVFVVFAGSREFSGWKAVSIGVAVHALSVAAGFSYARSQVRLRERRGFPITTKPDECSSTKER